MENVQREVIRVLLDHLRSLGLISNYTYSRAVGLAHSMADFPEFFRCPARPAEEADGHECAQNTQ